MYGSCGNERPRLKTRFKNAARIALGPFLLIDAFASAKACSFTFTSSYRLCGLFSWDRALCYSFACYCGPGANPAPWDILCCACISGLSLAPRPYIFRRVFRWGALPSSSPRRRNKKSACKSPCGALIPICRNSTLNMSGASNLLLSLF